MANEEQLSILKQGVEVWNSWRKSNPDVHVNLVQADLSEAKLIGANLGGADLREANLHKADIRSAHLRGVNLARADLRAANLRRANLRTSQLRAANLIRANFIEADLTGANLSEANLGKADLRVANLKRSSLNRANLGQASLGGANLDKSILQATNFALAVIGSTNFGTVDLREAIGLTDVHHCAPSEITRGTFILSQGEIPEIFLRGCGLTDWEIEMVKLYNPELTNEARNKVLYKVYNVQESQSIQISPLFISYSHADDKFVAKLEGQLNKKGVRFWRDIHDMKSGRIETQIDKAISQNPTVLLVLSEYSLKSDWVEHEVRTARGLEQEMGRDVLCPIALDGSWKSSHWPKRIMEQIMEYNILDFSEWKDADKFDGMFRRLIDGLELFYKG